MTRELCSSQSATLPAIRGDGVGPEGESAGTRPGMTNDKGSFRPLVVGHALRVEDRGWSAGSAGSSTCG
jgi:hypothetical protein